MIRSATITGAVLVTMVSACDPPSRHAGVIVRGGLSNAEAARLACETHASCCDDERFGPSELCEEDTRWIFDHQSEFAASYGLTRAPECFERFGECGPTLAEQATSCEPPCKLFHGYATLGEACSLYESGPLMDSCAQGLVCYEHSTPGAPETGICSDPCQPDGAGNPCRAGADAIACGPGAYCDAPIEFDAVGTCRSRQPIGSPCDPTHDGCVAEAYCDAQAEGGPSCVPVLEDGQPCVGDRTCRSRRCGDEPFDPDLQVGVCEPSPTDWCYEGGNLGDVLTPRGV